MRAVLGLLSLLMALAITSFLVRQQMKAGQPVLPAIPNAQKPGDAGTGSTDVASLPASATPAQQSQQAQQQFKQALDSALQARPMPDDQP